MSNAGTIATLTNSGTISGGGGTGGGRAGDAILSTGSIGPITNTGQIIGDVEIDNQASATIYGGTGATFGRWTGGTITVGNGDLVFAGGNTALSDNIVVNGGKGIVFSNSDPLMIAAPQTITGNFDQSAAGALDFALAGDLPGQYGALAITGFATLDGGLGLDLTSGFTLAAGNVFDLMTFAGVTGDFTGFCSTASPARRIPPTSGRARTLAAWHSAGDRGDRLPQPRRPVDLRNSRGLDLGDARDRLPRPRWAWIAAKERLARLTDWGFVIFGRRLGVEMQSSH